MEPPGGSGVAEVIPASLSAKEFTHAAWISERVRYTGISGNALSSTDAVGSGAVCFFLPKKSNHEAESSSPRHAS